MQILRLNLQAATKGTSMPSVKQVAIQIFTDYLKSKCFSRQPGWNRVYEWRDLLGHNQDNFLFVARWHLSRLKNIEAVKSAHNKQSKPKTKSPKR